MNKILRVGCAEILFLGCVVGALAQTGGKPSNKLTDSKSVANETTTNDVRAVNSKAAQEFVIGNGDVLAINVWKESEISRVVSVLSDGRISLPLVGEIRAGGRTPKQLETEITAKLRDYVSEPEVTVIVQEIKSQKFNVLGMVTRPGSYPLTKPMTVLDAIALAGGFRDFAKQKSIYVLRVSTDGTTSRIPFNYKDAIKGKHPEQNVQLEPRDTVYVP